MEEQVDFTKLKYVLYVRKSTDDPERQVRSIEDQIDECNLLAKRLGITIKSKPIIEKKSAKKPHLCPLFTQMLKDIRRGEYDGIIAWNPDRLARNMLEGGEIIDMIDEGEIKDLKFVTHHFTKDANGKMLLGMAFVLSKQYSDKLSQDVTRGVRRNLEEGKSPTPKHGYVRDKNGLYQPDEKIFELICTAWQMRKDGESLETIETYMNDNGYARVIKSSGQKVDMDMRILSDIFKDPFYYGILVQKGKSIDLRLLYDFREAVSMEDYMNVQSLYYNRRKPLQRRRTTFYPFKAMVRCAICGGNMYVGPSTSSSGERLLYYRCDNALCTRKKRSLRAKILLEFIYSFLEQGLHFTEDDYNKYYTEMSAISENNRNKFEIELHSKQAIWKKTEQEMNNIAFKIINFEKDSTIYKLNQKKLEELEEKKETLEEEIQTIKEQMTDPEQNKLTLEQFLNLSKRAAAIVKAGDAIVKDAICREIFLNFMVDEQKVTLYQLKEPFATLFKSREQHSSRDGGN